MSRLSKIAILFMLVFVSQGLTTDYRISEYAISEAETLASIINAECGICNDSEQRKTGSVVLNRVDSKMFPGTIDSVVSQKRQFSGYRSRHYYPSDKSLETAKDLLSGFGRVKEILYFWNPRIATDKEFIRKMQHRVVYKEKYHHYAK